jgi:hypothetical protein
MVEFSEHCNETFGLKKDGEFLDSLSEHYQLLYFSVPERIEEQPRALSRGVKRPRLEADHLPPAGAEIKEMLIHTSNPLYAFMV